MKLLPHVQIKESPGRGQGLFATNKIPKGRFLLEYNGWVSHIDDVPKSNLYCFAISKHYVLDGTYSLAGKINDADGILKRPNEYNNAQFIIHNKRVLVQAIRTIYPGQEILCAYGFYYWKVYQENRGLQTAQD